MIFRKKTCTKIFLGVILISFLSISLTSIAWGEPERVDVVILLDEGVDCKNLQGVEIKDHLNLVNAYRVSVSRFNFNKLKNLASIKWISEYQEATFKPMAEDFLPYGVDDINAEFVWGGSEDAKDIIPGRPSGTGVKVAVIDGGIQTNHIDLAQNYAGGYDFKDNDNNPMETVDTHGTLCAGVIAAIDNDLQGSVIGVSPEVQLYAIRTDISYWQIALGVEWCIAAGIDVISMSLAGSFNPMLEQVLSLAYLCNIIVVASSGNYPQMAYENWVWYPASSGFTLAVGAYDPRNRELGRIAISNGYSWSSCYGIQLGVLAPGSFCYSTKPTNSYEYFSGTSCAAPHVAGIAALMRAANPSISVNDVYGFIEGTADDVGPTGWDIENGYGIVNAYNAVMLAEAIPPTVDIFAPSYNYQKVSGSYQIKATAEDEFGILDSVKVKIDNGVWHDCTPISNYWAWTWDTTTTSEGNHLITCKATDLAGNTAQDQVYAEVDNIPAGGGGGGGCPILSVFDGEEYQEEGLLNIHNPDGIDVTYQHTLITNPASIDNQFHLKLTEHPKTISKIDKVKLLGVLPNNRVINLPLISAIHCVDGQVRNLLKFSDDRKVVCIGADYNDGVSQYIDLEFLAFERFNFTRFIFVIEGNNEMQK